MCEVKYEYPKLIIQEVNVGDKGKVSIELRMDDIDNIDSKKIQGIIRRLMDDVLRRTI